MFLHLGRDDLHIPEPLAGLLHTLTRDGRTYVGVGAPTTTRWLFPGLQPGRPLTAARLGDRASANTGSGHDPAAGPRTPTSPPNSPPPSSPTSWASPPTTAVNWVHDAGGDWNRYAAQLSQTGDHQP